MAFNPWSVDVGRRRPCRWFWTALFAATLCAIVAPMSRGAEAVRIAVNLDRPRCLAVSANGQTVLALDGRSLAIMAGDPSNAEPWREVVAGVREGLPQPVAIGCLPGDVVAAVCRAGDAWMLRTYRMQPDAIADPAVPLQVVQLGQAAGEGVDVALAVHHARNWLVVIGLPDPLPPVVRCALAGVRVGPPSDRACPTLPDHHSPVAVTTGAGGDMVLGLRSEAGSSSIAIYDGAGRELLNLPTGLKALAAIDAGRADRTLWATGVSADGRSGLWRLDATYRDNRQAVQPVLVCPLSAPSAMVSATDRAIVVIEGMSEPTVSRIDPTMSEKSGFRKSSP